MEWLNLALIAIPFFILIELIFKFTKCNNLDTHIYISLLGICLGIIGIISLLINKKYKKLKNIDLNLVLTIFLIAILYYFGFNNYWLSCKKAYSPGMTRAIFSGGVILLLILISSVFFNKKIDMNKILGLFAIIGGIYLLS